MYRCRGKFQGLPLMFRGMSLAAGVLLVLAGCGEGPGNPRPPYSPPPPPRPVTEAGQVSRAHLVLPARPVQPKPGMM